MKSIQSIINNNVNGSTFVNIDTSTDVKLTGGKKNPLQGKVTKKTVGSNVMVFQNKTNSSYDAMVKRRLEKEGKSADSFKLSPRTWGTRMDDQPFVEHKGQHYLEVIFLKPGESHYEVNGVKTPSELIAGLPAPKVEGKQGGLSDSVIIRTFKTSSITKVNINKESYEGPFSF